MEFETYLHEKMGLTMAKFEQLSLAEQNQIRIDWENYCEGFDDEWDDEMDFAWKTGTLYA